MLDALLHLQLMREMLQVWVDIALAEAADFYFSAERPDYLRRYDEFA